MKARAAGIAALALIGGCGDPEPPPPDTGIVVDVPPSERIAEAPPPPPSTAPGALPAPELDNVGTALGTWVERDGAALFGPPQGGARLIVACDREQGRVVFRRLGTQRSAATMRIVTATAAATMNAAVAEGPPRAVVGSLAAGDLFLTSLAATQDRFGVRIDRDRTLAMPADPLVGRVIAACRAPT